MQRETSAQYYHARQACYLCLNPNDVVDTTIQIDGEGVLAICRNCIGELAMTSGWVLSDNKQEVATLKGKVTRLTADLEDARAVIGAINLEQKRTKARA